MRKPLGLPLCLTLVCACSAETAPPPSSAARQLPARESAAFTASPNADGISPEKATYAVFGSGEISVDSDGDSIPNDFAFVHIIAGDRPGFCEQVVASFDNLIDGIGESVEGTFVHTMLWTKRLPTSGETLDGSDTENSVVIVRFSSSDGARIRGFAMNTDFSFSSDAQANISMFDPARSLSGSITTTLFTQIDLTLDTTTGRTTSQLGGDAISIHGVFDDVEECPALSSFIRSFNAAK